MTASQKISQNMQELLAEIGENAVLLALAGMARVTNWTVFKNIADRGYDILLRHKSGKQRKIEVKTRQRVWTTARDRNQSTAHFTVTRLERDSADVVVCYWWEKGWMFIVPTKKLKRAGRRLYKFVVRAPISGGLPGGDAYEFLERWSLVSPDFKDDGPLANARMNSLAVMGLLRSPRRRIRSTFK
jgi:hypothetical protein